MLNNEIKIFAGSSGGPFAKRMCRYIGVELGVSEVITFTEGNIFVRVRETVRDKDVYLVQPIAMRPNDEFVEVLFWMDAFKRASAIRSQPLFLIFLTPKATKRMNRGFQSGPAFARTPSKAPERTG